MIDKATEAEVTGHIEGGLRQGRSLRSAGWCAAAVVVWALVMPFAAMAEGGLLSVMELPAVEGQDGPQVAVKWSGALPVRLDAGIVRGKRSFVALGSSIVLTETTTLLPRPDKDPDAPLTWRVLDSQSRVLAQSRGHSASFGWQSDFFGPGVDWAVRAAAVYEGDVILGGQFHTAGSHVVNSIARWDGTAWKPLSGTSGIGVSGTVVSLAVYDGNLIVGGGFASAGGIQGVNGIARWDGSEWSRVSSAFDALYDVRALTVYDGDLIAGGKFTRIGSKRVNNIARWDGSGWSALSGPSGTGVDDWVSTLTVHDGYLVAGGNFDTAGGKSVGKIARWDGSDWSPLWDSSGGGLEASIVSVTTVYDGDLIVGGYFLSAAGEKVNHIARWDGSSWSALPGPSGIGMSRNVDALTVHDGELIAGGQFTEAGGVEVNRVARWDGSSWSALAGPSEIGMNKEVFSLISHDGELIAGGDFRMAGGRMVNHVARWDGTVWMVLGGSGTGLRNGASALIVYDGYLIVGNRYGTYFGDVNMNRIGRWDGGGWSPLQGSSAAGVQGGWVSALTIHDGDLIVGGNFNEAGGKTVNNIARWDGDDWSPFLDPSGIDGVSGPVTALTVYDGDLIVGGKFSTAGGKTVNNVARWDGSVWSSLPGSLEVGTDDGVFALSVHDGELIAGGRFSTAGGEMVNHIAGWNGNTWSSFSGPSGIGTNYWVHALTVHDGDLIVGGRFNMAGGVTVNRIARWDGSEWLPFMDSSGEVGVGGIVDAFTAYDRDLIVGGSFGSAGGVKVNLIARWNGIDWLPLSGPSGTGLSGIWPSVGSLTVFNGDLIVGGDIKGAGGVASWGVARYKSLSFYSVGGMVYGLQGSGLVLQNNSEDDLSIGDNGEFTFATLLEVGSSYNVTVLTQPDNPDQFCTVKNGSGTLFGGNVTDIEAHCVFDDIFADRFD